jgi:hypothetical protein
VNALESKEHNVTAPIPMFALRKNYVLDENQQPIAVQIAIGDFERLEAILEDYGRG